MILDNYIVEEVIGVVDVAEHNIACSTMSVVTTATELSNGSRFALQCSAAGRQG
jgi:hypothetical protein